MGEFTRQDGSPVKVGDEIATMYFDELGQQHVEVKRVVKIFPMSLHCEFFTGREMTPGDLTRIVGYRVLDLN
jgi:hypothetical protein